MWSSPPEKMMQPTPNSKAVMKSKSQNTKRRIWHTVIALQVALCAAFVAVFLGNVAGQPDNEKRYIVGSGTESLRHNIASTIADTAQNKERPHCVELILDRHIRVSCWMSHDADTLIVDSYLYYKNGRLRVGRINDPTFSGSSLGMQIEVISTFEREVLSGVTFRSETSHFEDAISFLYMLVAPWLGYAVPTLLFTIFLYRRVTKKADNRK